MQRVALQPGGELRFVDAFLRFAFGQDLHNSLPTVVRGKHNLNCVWQQEHKDAAQQVHYEVHRRDIIIVDDDAVERLVGCLLLLIFADFDFRRGLCFHLRQLVELFDFILGQFDLGCGEVLCNVLRVE